MAQRKNDPKSVLIRARKLPMSLLIDPTKENNMKILEVEKYEVNKYILMNFDES